MTAYTENFYKGQRDRSLTSAEEIVPELLRLISPKSVLDVGCGTGVWLSVFQQLGITDTLGLDGDWVSEQVLAIPKDNFRKSDLSAPLDLGRKFDLAISMEVGEHIQTDRADVFVQNIVRHAPAILFSAAIPMQGGTGHINEQWQSWWAEKFARHGYRAVDCMRGKFWNNEKVKSWYAQNMILYVDEKSLGYYPLLTQIDGAGPIDLVHPSAFLVMADMGRKSVGTLAKELPKSIIRAVKRRIARK